jgi:hypothetical protein
MTGGRGMEWSGPIQGGRGEHSASRRASRSGRQMGFRRDGWCLHRHLSGRLKRSLHTGRIPGITGVRVSSHSDRGEPTVRRRWPRHQRREGSTATSSKRDWVDATLLSPLVPFLYITPLYLGHPVHQGAIPFFLATVSSSDGAVSRSGQGFFLWRRHTFLWQGRFVGNGALDTPLFARSEALLPSKKRIRFAGVEAEPPLRNRP